MKTVSHQRTAIHYKDFAFRLIVCLIGAHIIILTGEDISTLQAFTIRSYYPTLLINYAIALILAWIVKRITVKLDRSVSWEGHLWLRALLQFLCGVVLVSLICFLLVFIYFRSFGRNVMESNYMVYQFPLSVALLALLNAFYVVYYFYHRVQILAAMHAQGDSYKNYLNVLEGREVISLEVNDIAYIFLAGKGVVVRSRERKDFLCERNLDELEEQLDPKSFFRINRQLIAHRAACKSYQAIEHGKLEVTLSPAAPEPATVSQRKAGAFKEWYR